MSVCGSPKKTTEPIGLKFTHNVRLYMHFVVVSFFSRPSNIFAIIDLVFLKHYNSKNTEPIGLKFTHNIRVGPVERGLCRADVDRSRLVSPPAAGRF